MAKDLLVRILGDPSDLSASLKKAGAETETFGSRMGSALKAGGIVAAAGIGVAVVALTDFTKAAMNQAASQAALDQALRNSGQSIAAMTPLIDTAEASSRQLGFTDQATTEALTRLEISTGNTTTAISDLSVAEDLSRARHQDLITSTTALAQAMTGSQRAAKQLGIIVIPTTAAVTALKDAHNKAKTAVTAHELAMAKLQDKMATGQMVIQAVTDKVHGQADAFSNTAAGAMARFQASWERLQVTLGQLFLPTLTRVANELAKGVTWIDQFVTATKELEAPLHRVSGAQDEGTIASRRMGDQMGSTGQAAFKFKATVDALSAAWDRYGPILDKAMQFQLKIEAGFVSSFAHLVRAYQSLGPASNAAGAAIVKTAKEISATISNLATVVYQEALKVGSEIANGIIDGVKNLAGSLGDKLKSGIGGAIGFAKTFAGIGSPSKLAADQIGKPIAEGIEMGYVLGSASLPAKMSASIKKALDAAKAQVDAARAGFVTSFGNLTSMGDTLLGSISGAQQTPAGKKLAAMQDADAKKQLQDSLTQAKQAADAAKATGIGYLLGGGTDPATIAANLAALKAAEDQVAAAKRAIVEANLAKEATQQQKNLDAANAVKQTNFDKALAALEAHLRKEGASAAKSAQEITDLFARYGVTYAAVGRDAGIAYIQALKDAIAEAAGKSGKLAGTIAGIADGISVPKRAAGGPVGAGGLYLVGERGPELFAPNMSGTIIPNGVGGGGTTIVRLILDGKQIHEAMIGPAQVYKRRNGSTGLA